MVSNAADGKQIPRFDFWPPRRQAIIRERPDIPDSLNVIKWKYGHRRSFFGSVPGSRRRSTNTQVAQRILDLEPEPDVVRRVEQLGEKSDAGTLTDEERDEYRRASRCGHIGCFAKSQGAAVPRSARYLIHGRTDAKTRASAGRRVL